MGFNLDNVSKAYHHLWGVLCQSFNPYYMAPLPGIPQKDFRCGAVEYLVKYDSYDIYESRKTSNQIIVLTVCEMQCYIIVVTLQLTISPCSVITMSGHCISQTVSKNIWFEVFLDS
jgi:hypothetical protein